MRIFGSAKVKCENCGQEVPAQSAFCPNCGARLGAGGGRCPHCNARINPEDRFCGQCGRELASVERPEIAGRAWARRPTDFAARVDVQDVPGLFRKSVTVEPGTNAILIQGGRNVGTMPPGQHTLDTLLARIGLSRQQPVTAILVDVGDTTLEFKLEGIYTADPVRLAMDCQIVLQLAKPVAFLTNLMRSSRSYTLEHLRDYLGPEVENAVREYIRTRKIEELNSSVQAKRDIELDIEAHLNRTLEETGLRLVQVRTLNYRCTKLDPTRQTTEEYYLEISRREAELAGKEMLFEVMKREDIQILAEQTHQVQIFEQRAAILDRMRKAVLSDKMDDVRTEEDLEVFLRDVDRRNLIGANEMEEFKRDFAERKQDHDLARAHLLAKLTLQREYELRRMELELRTDLSASELERALDYERKRIDGELEIQDRRIRGELEIKRKQTEFAREERLEEARTQAEIERVERQQDREDLDLALAALEGMKAKQRRDLEERNRIELERMAHQLDMEIKKAEAELERRLRLEQQQQEFELQKLDRFATMSAEALIVAGSAEQARMLAELKETEALRGMSEEQILARAAEKSPQVAAAFAEKFRSDPQMQQQVIELYERMVAEGKETTAARDEMQRQMMAQLQAMFEKAMDSQRDIATAYAQQQAAGTTVVVPGSTTQVIRPGETPSEAPREVIVCKKCLSKWDIGTRYCPNCGAELI